MSLFPHTCTISRPGADTRPIDTESGQPIGTAPSPVKVYEGKCRYTSDGQAVSRAKGGMFVARDSGETSLLGEGLLVLPKRAGVFDADTDTIVIQANGLTLEARITRVMYQQALVELIIALEEIPVAA